MGQCSGTQDGVAAEARDEERVEQQSETAVNSAKAAQALPDGATAAAHTDSKTKPQSREAVDGSHSESSSTAASTTTGLTAASSMASASGGPPPSPVLQPAAPAVDDRKSIVWLSVDPRTGKLSVYPRDVAWRIEEGFQKRQRSVPLKGLGGFYEHASIDLERTKTGRPEQRTDKGRRDVRRVVIPRFAKFVSLPVVKQSKWQCADEEVQGLTEEARVDLLGHEAIPEEEVPGSRKEGEDPSHEARIQAVATAEAKGLVGLWEWCRATKVSVAELESVPMSDWGLYISEQNDTIEDAFKAGKPNVKIVIGIRTFEIIFDGADYGRQVDHSMKKKRYVRRRLLSPTDRTNVFAKAAAAVASAVGTNTGDEDECAICCTTFEETPTVAAVRLKECGHIFHCPCVQHIADKKGQCPLCRTDINWSAALGQ